GQTDNIPRLFWTAMLMMLGLGLLLGLGIALATPALAGHLLKIPAHLQPEALRSFYIVAASMPVVITTTGLIGMLEAHQYFRAINFVRIPTGSFTFWGPLCVLPFSNSLSYVVAILLVGRLVETTVFLLLCLYKIPELRCRPQLRRELVRPLAGFGGWLTVSNLAMPLMAHMDRFFVGAVLSVAAVTYYVTPAEIVIKLLILPRAWVSVLFPAFSAGAEHAPEESARLFSRGLRYLPPLLFAATLTLVTLAPEGLQLWLNAEFAARSATVMRWLAAGVFLAGLAYVPFAFLQGAGRPDMPARLHLAELLLYVILAPTCIRYLGINGAGMAWFARAGLDLLIMLWLTRRRMPATAPAIRQLLGMALYSLAVLAGVAVTTSLTLRCVLAAGGGLLGVALYWRVILDHSERSHCSREISAIIARFQQKAPRDI
ncbi:MAG: polysaccharide biosynthesis C-terminal domain-containing protein, partial [Lentisphaerae bacterium]|nr:polysaccharide biosynthesis C-terminal domain-containing protein [Lentisphaerota bacterium]